MQRSKKTLLQIYDIVSLLAALWALSDNALTLLGRGFEVDIPVVKWIFVVFQSLDGQRINTLVMALGLGGVFRAVRERRRRGYPWVSAASVFLALCTVFGKSYAQTGSWDYIFYGRAQFCLAVFVLAGYYLTYRNCILFAGLALEKAPRLLRRETLGKAEEWLFERHSFLGPLLAVFLGGVPWLICFFPGIMESDAHLQLLMSGG